MAKIWLDDYRLPPKGFYHCYSVNSAKILIEIFERAREPIEQISVDYDLDEYNYDGGKGDELLLWLIERKTLYPVHLHTAHSSGLKLMQKMLKEHWEQA